MDEVDVEAVDLGDELRQRIEPRFDRAPVVIQPVLGQLLDRRERYALRTVAHEFSAGPARLGDAAFEVEAAMIAAQGNLHDA